jgi:dTDP-4-dehydrorhamnose reductase
MPQRVVVLGGSGFVGTRVRELWSSSIDVIAPSHAELDVLNATALRDFLRASNAIAVVNLAAWAGVDTAEEQRGDLNGQAYVLNARFPGELAQTCKEVGMHLVHVSTDYVFDGTRSDRPYRETDIAGPALCWYAETKLRGEEAVRSANGQATVVRIEMPFSGRNHVRADVARTMLSRLRAGQPLTGVVDQRITPVFLDDAVEALRLVIEERFAGVIHVAAASWTTPFEFARSIARRAKLDESLVQPEEFASFVTRRPARRPQHSWLDVSLFGNVFGTHILRPVEAELDSWYAQLAPLSV